MRFDTLQDWLAWQETLHPVAIDLGLDRFREALKRLGFKQPTCPVITIAGTKGKGSCATLLDHLYRAAGYRTGLFTSPHLLTYNERIRLSGEMVTDAELCAVFERIEAVRDELSLTYFEFNALAAFILFADAQLDLWIVEVGMGGRLDAANALDADIAIVTSIGLDHTEWLGNDLNSIAREKAGIARAQRPLIFGSDAMPQAIAEMASHLSAPLYRVGMQFGFEMKDSSWTWWWQEGEHKVHLNHLPMPGIDGAVQLYNASTALAAVQLLQSRLQVDAESIKQGLRSAHLSGRFQRHVDAQGIEWLLDVAHNTMSAEVLSNHLKQLPTRRTVAVLGVMADKDLNGMLAVLRPQIDAYVAVALPGTRALSVEKLVARLNEQGCTVIGSAPNVAQGCQLAQGFVAGSGPSRIVVFGSFLVVGPALEFLNLPA